MKIYWKFYEVNFVLNQMSCDQLNLKENIRMHGIFIFKVIHIVSRNENLLFFQWGIICTEY